MGRDIHFIAVLEGFNCNRLQLFSYDFLHLIDSTKMMLFQVAFNLGKQEKVKRIEISLTEDLF